MTSQRLYKSFSFERIGMAEYLGAIIDTVTITIGILRISEVDFCLGLISQTIGVTIFDGSIEWGRKSHAEQNKKDKEIFMWHARHIFERMN